jgi:hypothetical protein
VSRCNITLCNASSITSDWVSDCPGRTDRSASGGCGTATLFLSGRDVLDVCCSQVTPHVLDPIILVRPTVQSRGGQSADPVHQAPGNKNRIPDGMSVLGVPNRLATMGARVNIRSAGWEAVVANGARREGRRNLGGYAAAELGKGDHWATDAWDGRRCSLRLACVSSWVCVAGRVLGVCPGRSSDGEKRLDWRCPKAEDVGRLEQQQR